MASLPTDVVAERLRNVLDGLGSCGNGLVYLSGEGSVLAVDEAEERRSGLGVFVVDARAVAIEGVADGVDVVGVVVARVPGVPRLNGIEGFGASAAQPLGQGVTDFGFTHFVGDFHTTVNDLHHSVFQSGVL